MELNATMNASSTLFQFPNLCTILSNQNFSPSKKKKKIIIDNMGFFFLIKIFFAKESSMEENSNRNFQLEIHYTQPINPEDAPNPSCRSLSPLPL